MEITEKMETIEIVGRITASAYYDHQQVRIASMNRVRDVIRRKIEGIPLDKTEEKKENGSREKKYTDTVLLKKWNELLQENKITKKEHDYITKIWDIMKDSKKLENKYKTAMKRYISGKLVYTEFLNEIRGIGEVLSANLIKEFGDCKVKIYKKIDDKFELIAEEGDPSFEIEYRLWKTDKLLPIEDRIYRKKGYKTVSQLWAHSGNNVVNGKAPRVRKGEKSSFSPKLRTMTWKISSSLLTQNKGLYRVIYDLEKAKHLARIYEEGELEQKYGKPYIKTDISLKLGHAHNRALRKMRKVFLDHYWHAARELNGLPAKKNYVEGVLNHSNVVPWKEAITMEHKPEKNEA